MTIDGIGLAVVVVAPLLLGAALLGACGRVLGRGVAHSLAWSIATGLLVVGAVTGVWMLDEWPLVRGRLWAALAVLLVVLVRRAMLGARRAPVASAAGAPSPPPRRFSLIERGVFAVVVAACLALTVDDMLRASAVPIMDGNEAQIWAQRAVALHHAGGFNAAYQAEMSRSDVYITHRDYPVLNPLLHEWVFLNAGGITHVENRIPLQMAGLAMLVMLAAVLRRLVRPAVAAALLLVVHAMPAGASLLTTAGGEPLVALGGVMLLDGWITLRAVAASGGDTRPAAWRIALGAATLVWSQNLGVLLAALFALATAVGWWRARSGASASALPRGTRRRRVPPWAVLPAVAIAFTALLNWGLPAPGALAGNAVGTGPGATAAPVMEIGPVLLAYARALVNPAAGHLVVMALVLVVLLVLRAPRRVRSTETLVPVLWIAAGLAALPVAFLRLGYDTTWLTTTGIDRFLWQLAPAATVTLALVARAALPSLAATPDPPAPDGVGCTA